jgi:ATP-dependent Zn protease
MDNIIGGASMEHNSTINCLLTELDGFTSSDNVLVIGATNMHTSLDNALTRSGRLNRTVVFDHPNCEERKQLIELYFKNKKFAPEIQDKFKNNLEFLSKRMAGLTPADIKNIANQSALINMINVKSGKTNTIGINLDNIEQAIDEVLIGIEKRERSVSKEEQKIIAYHESGHTLMSLLLKDMESPIKTSIIPRGINALGYSQTDGDDKKLHTREYLIAKVCILLGGRSAEKLIFNTVTTGAYDDLEKSTQLILAYLTKYGMSKQYGLVTLNNKEKINKHDINSIKLILDEIQKFVDILLHNNKDELEKLAEKLLEKEVLNKQDTIDLITKDKLHSIEINELVYTIDKI